ncbi:MAG: M3 family oligoendopeptidase, partial [Planctomycetes bacterium]|nr:M3 family oligoendopeptidase [Planctomycetota bacterium]
MPSTAYPRNFLDTAFIPKNWDLIAPIYEDLMARTLTSVGELESLLVDISELEAVVGEYAARLYVKKDLDTTDEAAAEAWKNWQTNVQPKLSEANFKLQQKWASSPLCDELNQDEFGIYIKRTRAAIELFREENLPLQVEESTLATEYGKIVGTQAVE